MKHKFLWVIAAIVLVAAGVCVLQGEPDLGKVGEAKGDKEAYLNLDTEEPEDTKENETTKKDTGYYGALRVNGTELCDAEGNPVQLRGVSTHGISWYPEYVNDKAVAFMHQKWGINVLRIALYTTGTGGYCVTDEASQQVQKDTIDIGVQAAKANDMYVIIDWHILEDNNPNRYIGRSGNFFREISEKYKDYDNVIYEICNEPSGDTTWENIKSYAQEIIPIIRENDEDAVIIVGTPNWSQDVDVAAADPIRDMGNIMYALHFYAGTHKQELREKAEKAMDAGLPIFVSEFGICDASGNGTNDTAEADNWMKWMNEKMISCVQWNLSNKDEASSLIQKSSQKTTDWKDEDLSDSGKWMIANIGGLIGRTITAVQEDDSGEKPNDTESNSEDTGDSSDAQAGNTTFSKDGITVSQTNTWETNSATCTQYGVDMKNQSGVRADTWTLTVDFSQEVKLQNSWCGKYTVSGKTLTITPQDFNAEVDKDGVIDNVGFILESDQELSIEAITIQWK